MIWIAFYIFFNIQWEVHAPRGIEINLDFWYYGLAVNVYPRYVSLIIQRRGPFKICMHAIKMSFLGKHGNMELPELISLLENNQF